MLNTTIELITLATSNSLLVFCFCNLIIVILLFDGSKSSTSQFDEDDEVVLNPPHIIVINGNKNGTKGANACCKYDKEDAFTEVTVALNVDNVLNDDKEGKGQKEEEEEVDDELRRRVEEFIDKINRGWKAEKLRNSLSIQ